MDQIESFGLLPHDGTQPSISPITRWVILSDILVGYFSGLACYYGFGHCGHAALVPHDEDMLFMFQVPLGSMIAAFILHEPRLDLSRNMTNAGALCKSVCVHGAVAFTFLLVLEAAFGAVGQRWFQVWFITFGLLVISIRSILLMFMRRKVADGEVKETIAVAGYESNAGNVITRLSAEADAFLVPGEDEDVDEIISALRILGNLGAIDTVVLVGPFNQGSNVSHIVEKLELVPVEVNVCTEHAPSLGIAKGVRRVGKISLTIVARRPSHSWGLAVTAFLRQIWDLASRPRRDLAEMRRRRLTRKQARAFRRSLRSANRRLLRSGNLRLPQGFR